MNQVFETTDPEVASDIFRSQYTFVQMQVRGSRPLLRVAQESIGRVRLDRATLRMALTGHADPVEAINILRIHSGIVRYSYDGSEASYGPDDVCFPLPTGRPWSTSFRDVNSELLVLDPALLNETAGDHPAQRPAVRLLSDRPYSTAAADRLWRMVQDIRAMVAAQPDPEASPLVIASAERLVAASVLAAFPSTVQLDPTAEDRHDAHPDTLRRAIAFIEANADRDISVAEIAADACVTIRAVQLAFRRHLDTTPTAYLRRARLDHAHHDLRVADPATTTVSAIAARWGFVDHSRFAASYRDTYGVTPSQTLRH